MIAYFVKDESDFTSNGLGVLDDNIINPVVAEELNGIFKLEFDYPTHALHGSELIHEIIVRCPVPDMPDQLFRISEREADINGIFHIVAYHVFYDLAQNLIEDTFIVNKNGSQAMSQLLGATQFSHGFTSNSDIADVNNARMVRLNVVEAILDVGMVNSFISRWGGEIIRNNFQITMQTVRGSDNGVSIRDKKNLTGYRADIDLGTVITRIMPMGFDGLLLPEKYVDSPIIGNYQTPRIRIIKYDNVKAAVGEYADDEDAIPLEDAYTLLRQLAAYEFSDNHADIPKSTYSIEFAPLEQTEEYKNFAALETIDIGDTVRVVHEDDGLDITARMVSYTYNPLTRAYISIQLGNTDPTFTSALSEIRSVAVDAVQRAADDGLIVLPSASDKRTVNYYGTDQPTDPHVGDIWYKENGDKLELWIYETRDGVTQWYPLLTDLTQEAIKQELQQAEQDVEDAKNTAESALSAGQAAAQAAATAQTEAEDAVSKANQAFDDATNALSQSETALISIGEINSAIGVPFKVSNWEQGSLSTSTGAEIPSSTWVRSGYIDVAPGDNYIAQLMDGTSLATRFHFYGINVSYTDFVPTAQQYTETQATGVYDNNSIIQYLNSKNVEAMSITGSVTSNPYSSSNDMIIIYRIPLGSKTVPNIIQWTGYEDTSDNIVLLYTNGAWEQIDTITASSTTVYTWTLTDAQMSGITSGNVHIAFFSIKTGSYAGIYNKSTTPFTLNPLNNLLYQISYTYTTGAVTVPTNTLKMRVSTATNTAPEDFPGNVFPGTARVDYTKVNTLYSALLMQQDLINLRVAKNDVVNQINISTEGILISGDKIHITGQTTIDNAVIGTAMIADAAINNAKIANLDAAKINTGTLSADRIAAGSITSAKLTIANGFIINAMIADATIQSAKIAAIDAAKITTGTLSAAVIGANSITADKLATNAIQVGLAGWTNAIRITPYDISWYNGSTLEGNINSTGMSFYYGTRFIGAMGESMDANDNTRRGISTHLNGQGDYVAWAYRTGTSGTYSRFFTLDPKGVISNGEGIHMGASLRTNGFSFYSAGNRPIYLGDVTLNSAGPYPYWANSNGSSGVVLGSSNLYLITNGQFCSCTSLISRMNDLISRMNALITRLNNGWIVSISKNGGDITWSYYTNTGLTTMSNVLT